MKLYVLIREPSENDEILERLNIKSQEADSLVFRECHIRKEDVSSIIVYNHHKYGDMMQIYIYGEENVLSCKYDNKVIGEIFS